MGKTSITLAAIKFLKDRGLINKVLVIAPMRVCHTVWPNETQIWTDFNSLKTVILHGKDKDDLLKEKADIYCVNPEGVEWLTQATKVKHRSRTGRMTTTVKVDRKRWKKLGFDTLVIDELTKFKNHQAVRFKAMKEIIDLFGRRWGLTGSPAANGLIQLFGQCYMLDEGRTLGKYITHFRNQYYTPSYNGFDWILKEGAEQQIYERLAPLALRMGEGLIDMPKLVNNNIYVELPDKARLAYDKMEDDLIASIEGKQVTASTAGAASGKCRQIASGAIYLDQDVQALVKLPKSQREWAEIHDTKLDALEDLIDELQGAPLLCAYDFNHSLARLRKRFPKAVFAGDYTMKQFIELEASWNRGEIDLLFSHAQSIGHGLNLQKAKRGNHVCWFDIIWDYEIYDQFIRRVRRQGSKAKRIYNHHIVVRGTIDELVLSSLKSKKTGQNALFSALLKLAHSRK